MSHLTNWSKKKPKNEIRRMFKLYPERQMSSYTINVLANHSWSKINNIYLPNRSDEWHNKFNLNIQTARKGTSKCYQNTIHSRKREETININITNVFWKHKILDIKCMVLFDIHLDTEYISSGWCDWMWE